MNAFSVSPVTASDADALAAFFTQAGSTCFCRYWHFEGDKNAWLERSAFHPEQNEADLQHGLKASDGTARGLCARDAGGRVVGWLKLSTLASVPKLRKLGVYRRLDLDEAALVVGCILVAPEFRAQGIARGLIRAAVAHVRETKAAPCLYAFPRKAEARLHDEEAWMGPYMSYLREGFAHGKGEEPYPVLVHMLG